MKNLIIVTAFLLTSSISVAQSKIGLVDMQKAVQATAAGKKAKAELEGEFSKRKKEMEKKEADLRKMGEDLEKKKSVLSEEALQKKQMEWQEEMMKYRTQVAKAQEDIQKKDRELTQPILEKMRRVIEKVAKEKGMDMVIENTPMMLYSQKSNDLTEDVIKAFEKEK